MSQRTRAHTTDATARPTSRSDRAAAGDASAEQSPVETPDAPAPRRGKRAAAQPAASAHAPDQPLSPDALARALRAVATELERDHALAHRVAQAIVEPSSPPTVAPRREPAASRKTPIAPATIGRTFHPTIITGIAEELGPGVPDPFALRERLGEPGLREALESLRLGSLRAIIRQHGLDASGHLSKLNDADKLRAHIVAATRKGTN